MRWDEGMRSLPGGAFAEYYFFWLVIVLAEGEWGIGRGGGGGLEGLEELEGGWAGVDWVCGWVWGCLGGLGVFYSLGIGTVVLVCKWGWNPRCLILALLKLDI